MAGVGEGVDGANGDTSGTAVGSGEGANGDGVTCGDGVTRGDCDGAGGPPAHAARIVIRTVARTPNPQRTRRCSALEIARNRCGIADVITNHPPQGFLPRGMPGISRLNDWWRDRRPGPAAVSGQQHLCARGRLLGLIRE
jgi:hypothetical protein